MGYDAPYAARAAASSTKLFFPVFEGADLYRNSNETFAGIAVPAAQGGEFEGLFRVRDEHAYRSMTTVWLPSDRKLFQACQKIGLPGVSGTPRVPPFKSWECAPSK
jgi:hypothetical protein